MFYKIILFFIGFLLKVIGFTFIIIYLNLMTIGYSFIEYLKYIMMRIECLITIVGIIFINISFYKKGDRKNDIYI